MIRALIALLVLSLTLSACGTLRTSRVNPFNWFSRSTEGPALGQTGAAADTRPLVPQVDTLVIERTSTGAIVRAEAVMPVAGWWDAALIAENHGRPVDGVMTYRFVAARPVEPVSVTSAAARTISAAAVLSVFDLEVVTEVVVTGAGNSRRARR